MLRLPFMLLLLLCSPTMSLARENPSPQRIERELPCTSHPVSGRICLNEEILDRFLVRRVPPKPADTASAHGEVILRLIVGRDGKPVRIFVVSGKPALTRSAVRAVKQWLFKPYIYNGEYIEMEGRIHLQFPDSKVN